MACLIPGANLTQNLIFRTQYIRAAAIPRARKSRSAYAVTSPDTLRRARIRRPSGSWAMKKVNGAAGEKTDDEVCVPITHALSVRRRACSESLRSLAAKASSPQLTKS